MTVHLPAALYALFLWWFLTGAIMYGAALPGTRSPLLAFAALLAAAGLALVAATAAQAEPAGAVLAFSAALMVWSAVEIGFLTGAVTGPNREPCPADCGGGRRLRLAVEAILHHELALLAAGAAIAAASWGGENQTALQIFAVLWAMRLSTKLNLFLGVPATQAELLPERLRYLASYFRTAPLNPLFPVSVTLGTAAVLILGQRAVAEASAFEATRLTLVTTFLALAVLEHWFMALPRAGAVLWRWSLPVHRRSLPAAECFPLVGPTAPALNGILRRTLLTSLRRP